MFHEHTFYIYQLVQTSLEFPFGTTVDAVEIVDPSFQRYQDVFYNNFNYAVFENKMKWRQMEPIQVYLMSEIKYE